MFIFPPPHLFVLFLFMSDIKFQFLFNYLSHKSKIRNINQISSLRFFILQFCIPTFCYFYLMLPPLLFLVVCFRFTVFFLLHLSFKSNYFAYIYIYIIYIMCVCAMLLVRVDIFYVTVYAFFLTMMVSLFEIRHT